MNACLVPVQWLWHNVALVPTRHVECAESSVAEWRGVLVVRRQSVAARCFTWPEPQSPFRGSHSSTTRGNSSESARGIAPHTQTPLPPVLPFLHSYSPHLPPQQQSAAPAQRHPHFDSCSCSPVRCLAAGCHPAQVGHWSGRAWPRAPQPPGRQLSSAASPPLRLRSRQRWSEVWPRRVALRCMPSRVPMISPGGLPFPVLQRASVTHERRVLHR
jgi:hypothetical protein